ncbi:MAG: hypothetical protein NTZ35_18275 [Ignavibacteriales bacterium]|nr:hypothetical protein [Ignavibacteriales bacterium]
MKIVKDICVCHPKESDSKRFDEILTITVVFSCWCSEVTFTVYLNGELQFWAVEIYDVLINAVLSAELVSQHLAAREMHPKNGLGFGEMTPKKAPPILLLDRVEVQGHRKSLSLDHPM